MPKEAVIFCEFMPMKSIIISRSKTRRLMRLYQKLNEVSNITIQATNLNYVPEKLKRKVQEPWSEEQFFLERSVLKQLAHYDYLEIFHRT